MQSSSEQELAVQEQASEQVPLEQEPAAEKPSDAAERPSDAAERPSDAGDFRSHPNYLVDLERARLEAYRQGQGDIDRRLAQERQRWGQQNQQEALMQHLSSLHQEDPDEFTRLISQPDVAEIWAKAKQQPRQEALRQATDIAQAELLRTFIESGVMDNISEKTRDRMGRIADSGPQAFWPVVFGDVLDELAEKKAEQMAEKKAATMVEAKYNAYLAEQQKGRPSPEVSPATGRDLMGYEEQRRDLLRLANSGGISPSEALRKLNRLRE